ncbi:glycosyltransferase [Streptomyces kaempferi]
MQKRVARRLPSVLTVSGTSRQEIVDHLGVTQDRIHVVHIGADTDLFSPDPAVPQVPGRIVTTSSADVPLKGLVHLVEALAKVRAEHPGAHLVVVGRRAEDGPVAQAIERYGLERAVEFVKGISDAELVDLVRSAEVACVPSLYEGFSLPAAEAMATGTPLVATTGGAIPEVAGPDGETCLAVPPGDAGALAASLSAPGRPGTAREAGLRRARAGPGALHLGPRRPGHGRPLPRGHRPRRGSRPPPLRAGPRLLRAGPRLLRAGPRLLRVRGHRPCRVRGRRFLRFLRVSGPRPPRVPGPRPRRVRGLRPLRDPRCRPRGRRRRSS